MLLVTMHLCSEILSLIPFPLLPPLTIVIIVIIVIVYLMIIASPALSFCARWNPAISTPQSHWQIVSFGGGLVADLGKNILHIYWNFIFPQINIAFAVGHAINKNILQYIAIYCCFMLRP
jgi:hypothetical protein